MKVNFIKSWSEATRHKPDQIEKTSKKGGKYTTDGFKTIRLIAISEPDYDDRKQKYVYHAVDNQLNMEYEAIKAPNKVTCRLGTILEFINMSGGLAGDHTWFNADEVKVIPREKK